MAFRLKTERALEMEREMLSDLQKIGFTIPSNLVFHEFFCTECGGVVVISSGANSLKESECRDCGITQCLQTCHRRKVPAQSFVPAERAF